jgi:hypothetical protein
MLPVAFRDRIGLPSFVVSIFKLVPYTLLGTGILIVNYFGQGWGKLQPCS